MARVAIVGAGLAGYTTARTLRDTGYDGEIVVVGAESHRPYDRPALSKSYLAGEIDAAELSLETAGERLDVDWRLGTPATGLDVPGRTLEFADGSTLPADEIVLATGSAPRRLVEPAASAEPDVPGRGASVHVLDTIEHADALRAALVPGAAVVVAGAGFVGLEAAATALALGAASVTVACAGSAPLGRFGAPASAAVRTLHERRGVRFVTGARVAGLGRGADGLPNGVRLDDGRRIEGSVVIVGLGSVPDTAWLAGSGLARTQHGAIVCDEAGRAAPGIHAAGDCAAWPGSYGGHWTLAQEQAREVARDIVTPTIAPEFRNPPYLWSDQHGARLQFAGRLRGDERISLEAGSLDDSDPFLVYRDPQGVEVAALGIDQGRLMTRWRKTHRTPAAPRAAVAA